MQSYAILCIIVYRCLWLSMSSIHNPLHVLVGLALNLLGNAAVKAAARIEDDDTWRSKLPDFLIQQAGCCKMLQAL